MQLSPWYGKVGVACLPSHSGDILFSSSLILLRRHRSSFFCPYSVYVGQLENKLESLAHFGLLFTVGVLLQKTELNRSIKLQTAVRSDLEMMDHCH